MVTGSELGGLMWSDCIMFYHVWEIVGLKNYLRAR